MLKTLDYTFRISSSPTFLHFDLYTFSSLWLAVNDDYRMVCYRMTLRLSGTAVTAGLPHIEKFAFRTNNTGRNWTEFWFIVFKTWSFSVFFWGGRALNVGPWVTFPMCSFFNPRWGSWTNNPVIVTVIACDIFTCVYTRVYWFHFRTCDTINIRFLKMLFPCWTYFGGINCYYYIYFQYLQRDQT